MNNLSELFNKIRENKPLIHCITSPIAINDCANAVLGVGARPIMAEHPKEAAEITAMADALSVSLANITDARAESIMISGKTAKDRGIPCVIDAVGIACSKFRRELANDFIGKCSPAVIKGNVTEIRALCGLSHGTSGVDTSEADKISAGEDQKASDMIVAMREMSVKTGAVILATGEADMAADGENGFIIYNGSPYMSKVTGTGCILSCLIAAFLSAAEPMEAAVAATAALGIAGETADPSDGLGSYHIHLLDKLSLMDGETFEKYKKISSVSSLPF